MLTHGGTKITSVQVRYQRGGRLLRLPLPALQRRLGTAAAAARPPAHLERHWLPHRAQPACSCANDACNGSACPRPAQITTPSSPLPLLTSVTGLVGATACTLDAGGSGDLVVLNNNGADVLIIPGASLPNYDASSATPFRTLAGVSAAAKPLAVAADTTANPKVFFVSVAGSR